MYRCWRYSNGTAGHGRRTKTDGGDHWGGAGGADGCIRAVDAQRCAAHCAGEEPRGRRARAHDRAPRKPDGHRRSSLFLEIGSRHELVVDAHAAGSVSRGRSRDHLPAEDAAYRNGRPFGRPGTAECLSGSRKSSRPRPKSRSGHAAAAPAEPHLFSGQVFRLSRPDEQGYALQAWAEARCSHPVQLLVCRSFPAATSQKPRGLFHPPVWERVVSDFFQILYGKSLGSAVPAYQCRMGRAAGKEFVRAQKPDTLLATESWPRDAGHLPEAI